MNAVRIASIAAVLVCVASLADAQATRNPVFVVGGDLPRATALSIQGIQVVDFRSTTPVFTSLVQPGFVSRFAMDRDNRHIVFAVQGSSNTNTLYNSLRGGVFRVDPTSGRITTIIAPPWSAATGYHSFYHIEVDYNGDYVCGLYDFDRLNPQNSGYRIWRLDDRGVPTTLAGASTLPTTSDPSGALAVDIDTGHLLLSDQYRTTTPTTLAFPLLSIDTEDGTITTAHTGAGHGWYGFWSITQNHRTGAIEGPWGSRIFRVQKNQPSRTTVTVLPGLPYGIYGPTVFDLQSAPSPKIHAMSFVNTPLQTVHYEVDATTWAVTATVADPSRKLESKSMCFYRGRNTQTVRRAPRQWDVRFSAPEHAGKSFAATLSLRGVRPGVTLPDGRRLNLNPDPLSTLALSGALAPLLRGNTGFLDASGEATATLDLRSVRRLGVPCWIAWIVIDPAAPGSIAFIPDTFVMRI